MDKNKIIKPERVQKIIAKSGLCSRRKAEELIEQGKVKVNSKIIKVGDKAGTDDVILVNNKEVKKGKKIYIMLNKPKGYISTSKDFHAKNKVIDLIKIPERIFSVGRLDKDTEGLLLLTNDGEWANKLMHPRYEKEKEYIARLNKPIKPSIVSKMNMGFTLEDGFIKPKVKLISADKCNVIIKEGRKRIVRRMFDHFGYKVTELKRIRMGKYKLDDLESGKWKHISPK